MNVYVASLTRLCLTVMAVILFVFMSWSSKILHDYGVAFDLHVRMSIVSIQMLICGLVMLAYHGCVFLYDRAVSFRYRNIADMRPPEDTYSTYVIEESPENSNHDDTEDNHSRTSRTSRTSRNSRTSQASTTVQTEQATQMHHLNAPDSDTIDEPQDQERHLRNDAREISLVNNPTGYVMFAHCVGLLLWLTLFYIDFFDQYTTVLFVAGAAISWFSVLIFDGPYHLINVSYRIAYFCCTTVILAACRVCSSYDLDDVRTSFDTESSFTLLENILPFATGAVWVLLFKYKDMPRDVHAALGTSALLCLPALVRMQGNELYNRIDELHSDAWAILFVLQPLLKFLCMYAWILALSTERLRVVLSACVFALLPFYLDYCIMDETTSQVFFVSLAMLIFLECVYIVLGTHKTDALHRLRADVN